MFPSVELLESRIAPAGVITLSADDIGYLLIGDSQNNELAITQSGNEITLTPQNGTSILNEFAGETAPSSDPVTLLLLENELAINMGTGSDVLSLNGLSLFSDLEIIMGDDLETGAADNLTIVDLNVEGSLFVALDAGNALITGDRLRVGFDAVFVSVADTFTVDVESFYVGDDLVIDASIGNASDRFRIAALDLVVYDDLTIIASVFDPAAPMEALSFDVDGLLNVGGTLFTQNNSFGRSNVQIGAGVVVISQKVIVENKSNDISETLNLEIDADVLRIDKGLNFTSNSPAPSNVSLSGDLVLVDGPIVTKLTKSSGSFSILADVLQIEGNVSFSTKGYGLLQLEGGGDIFGKVTASLGSGTGEVVIDGSNTSPLKLNALTVTAPAKLPLAGAGVQITLNDAYSFGRVSLLLGRGEDTININDSVFRSAVAISTGDGSDKVNIHTVGDSVSEFRGGLGVSLGGGNDELTLASAGDFNEPTALLIFGPSVFNGGGGSDTYTSDNRNLKFFKSLRNLTASAPIVRAIEVRS